MNKILSLIAIITIILMNSFESFAQPANDDCLGSFNVIDDGSCISGTTVNATDNWNNLIGCQGGPGGPNGTHPDVWYSFTATNSSFSTTVTEGLGWAGTIELTLLEPDATGCGGIWTELASNCGNTSVTMTTTGLVPGNTYYIIVSNPQNGTPGAFDICTETTAAPSNCSDNDDCSIAETISLPASGSPGSQICITDCNTGAAPGINFVGNPCYQQNSPTVYYQFTTDNAAAELDITITSTDLTDPVFTIWSDNCPLTTYYTAFCGENSVLQGPIEPNTTYYIAVSDNNGGEGSFDLCINQNIDQSTCNIGDEIIETSSSDPSTPVGGPYSAGEQVTFCYTINEYLKENCNWLQGIVPTFGDCWDPSSFDADGMPNVTTPLVTAANETGNWNWWPDGAVQYNNLGASGSLPAGSDVGAGWFFVCTGCSAGNNGPTPNESWGDGGGFGNGPNGNCALDGNGLTWTVCFELIAGPASNCSNGTTDCSVSMKTYADAEIGSYSNLGCAGDQQLNFAADYACCPIYDNPGNQEVCDSYTLPVITGSLLTGNEMYYTGSLGTGTSYNAGDVINYADFGAYPIDLYIYDATSCGAEVTFQLTIGETPIVSLSPFTGVCENAGVQSLGGGTVTGGIYSGPGVTDDNNGTSFTFDPLAAGVNVHTITYTVTTLPNPPGCSAFDTETIEVFAQPALAFTALADLCINEDEQTGLGGATPTGGVYSGAGVTDDNNGSTYSFDPSVAGVGVHNITYSYTDANTCSNSIIDQVEVFSLPVLTFTALNDLCINAGVQTLLSGATPVGGEFFGPGVTDNGNGSTYSFDPNAAGVGIHTISYTYSDGNSCTDTITDQVEVFAAPLVALTDPGNFCSDDPVQAGLNGGTPLGGTYSGPGVTDNANDTYDFSPNGAGVGVHDVVYSFTDGNSCTNSDTIQVEVFLAPVLTFPVLNDVCIDAGNQTLGGATPTGGVYSGTGVTDDGNGTSFTFDPTVAGVGPHTITYNYTDGNSCSDFTTQTITVDDTPTINGTLEACIGQTQNLVGSGTPNGTNPWISSNGAIAGVDVNGQVSAVADGSVTITYTDINGCTADSIFTVNPTPVITLDTLSPSICDGLNGQITVNGAGTGTVTWSGAAAGNDSPVALPYVITGLGAGNYNVFFTDDATTCSSASVAAILLNPGAPEIFPIDDTASCEIDFIVPDPVTFTSGNNLTAGIAFYSASGGNAGDLIPQGTPITSAMSPMTIFVYDNNGTCDAEVSFIVNVNTNPTAAISPDPAEACEGNAINLNGNPAGGSGTYTSHTWTGDVAILNATNIVNPIVSALTTPNTYNLTYQVIDNNGCTTTDDIQVVINDVPDLSGTLDVCVGLTTSILSTGTPDAVTPWTSSNTAVATVDNAGVVTGLTAGSTDITFLDANGCSNTVTVTVNANPVISLTPTQPTGCNLTNGSLLIQLVSGLGLGSIALGGDSVNTFNPITLPYTISNLGAGTYDVILTDNNSCVSNNPSETLINPNAPIINPISDTVSCAINFVVPDAATWVTGTDLTGNQEFYDAPGGNIADLVAATTVITAAMSPMTLYAYDANGSCNTEESFVITINALPTINIAGNNPICDGEDITLTENGGSANSWNWSSLNGSATFDDNTVDVTTISDAVNNEEFQVVVTDANNCSDSASVIVTVNALPAVNIAGNNPICIGQDITLTEDGGDGTLWNWSSLNGSATFNDNTLASTTISGVANFEQIQVVVTDVNNCSDSDYVFISVVNNPSIDPLGPITACDSYDLPPILGTNLSGNQAYYDDTQINGGNIVAGPITATSTIYMYDGANGCEDEQLVQITINNAPSVTGLPSDATYCDFENIADLNVDVSGIADWTIYYSLDGVNQSLTSSSAPINIGNSPGTYIIDSIADLNCTGISNESFTITVNPTPLAPTVSDDGEFCSTDQIPNVTANGGSGTFNWYLDDNLSQFFGQGPEIAPINQNGTTTYYVTETANNCEGPSSIVNITINDCELIIPTAFTPNYDGNNDTWEIIPLDDAYPNNAVFIYNRWGALLFEHNSQTDGPYNNNQWDGTFNGEELPVGSYFFVIQLNDQIGQSINGAVSIIKEE